MLRARSMSLPETSELIWIAGEVAGGEDFRPAKAFFLGKMFRDLSKFSTISSSAIIIAVAAALLREAIIYKQKSVGGRFILTLSSFFSPKCTYLTLTPAEKFFLLASKATQPANRYRLKYVWVRWCQ